MRTMLCLLIWVCSAKFLGAMGSDTYKIEKVLDIQDGALGVKKIFFELDCNQTFLQTLSESSQTGFLDVAVLTKFNNRNCDDPRRRVYTRVSSQGLTLRPVEGFSEVWACEGYCFTPGGPDMPPYYRFVSAYGTSEKQATQLLGCTPPYLRDLSCQLIDTGN